VDDNVKLSMQQYRQIIYQDIDIQNKIMHLKIVGAMGRSLEGKTIV